MSTEVNTLKQCPYCAQSLETCKEMGRQLDKDSARIANLTYQRNIMLEAAKEVESWWLKDGMHQSVGAAYAIFAIRAAIAKAEEGNTK